MRIFKWLDSKVFPEPSVQEYEEDMRYTAKVELAQALDALDRAEATVAYRTKQLARLNKNVSTHAE